MSLSRSGVTILDLCTNSDTVGMSFVLDESQSCISAMLEELLSRGVNTFFSTSDSYMQECRLIIRNDHESLDYILTKHDRGAVIIADGFARISGRPACVLTEKGCFFLEAATAIAQSCADGVPMVLLSITNPDLKSYPQDPRGYLPSTHFIQEHFALTVMRVNSPEQGVSVIARSLAKIEAPCKRPVIVEVSSDMKGLSVVRRKGEHKLVREVTPSPDVISQLRSRLLCSERPFFIFGRGAVNAAKSARWLVEHFGAVCVSTLGGKGVIDESSPFSLGANLGHEKVNAVLNAADLVIAVGTCFRYYDTYDGALQIYPDFIRIDIDPDALLRGTPFPVLGVVSDATLALDSLVSQLSDTPKKLPWRSDIAKISAHLRISAGAVSRESCVFLDAIRKALPVDGIVFTDTGEIFHDRYFITHEPASWLHVPGADVPGYALLAAIGGKIAAPSRKIIALADKKGISYGYPELFLPVGRNLSLPIVVWDTQLFARQTSPVPVWGNQFSHLKTGEPKLKDIAKAYDLEYVRVATADELSSAISSSFELSVPIIIEPIPYTQETGHAEKF